MKNLDIRKEIADAGLRLWQVADKLGFQDNAFSRKLRKEFSTDEKTKIRNVIKELAKEHKQGA